jgi:hypothetical protein
MTEVLRMKNGMTVKEYRMKVVQLGLYFIAFVLANIYIATLIPV